MANGVKEYKIVINGIQESVNAVESLNKQLNDLEQRINTLNSKGITVKQTGGGSALEEQDKLQKQILATEEKLAQVRDENYKTLLHMKEELKEYTQIAKSQVAAEANQQGLFDTNTMAGMKAQLKSIKQEMQTVEIGGDRFNELTRQANELNNKLKEIEQSYGQFGRNVGNYADGVAKGMQSVKVTVNGVEREFKSASGASRTLKNELRAMAVEGKRGTEEYKELQKTLAQFSRTVKDATVSSEGMNNLLHTMQSLVAIGQVTQGFSALFGFDDSEIQRSIQKLVALQNAMMGIEKLNQQINERTGIGKWLAKGNTAIDNMVKSMLGLTTATKGATVATRALGVALKSIGIGLVITAIAALVDIVDDFLEKQKEAKEEAKKTQETINKSITAYNMAKAELSAYADVVNNFNGTKKAEKQLVDELNDKYGKALGTYKTLAEWKDVLKQKTEAYCEALMMEVQLAAAAKKLEEAYMKQMDAKNYEASWWEKLIEGSAAAKKRVQAVADQNVKIAEDAYTDLVKKLQKHNQENKLFDFSDQIGKNGKKIKKAVKDVQDDINKAEIDAMRDGLNKELMQLEEDKRQTINKLKENGKATEENVLKVEQAFYNKRIEIIKKYLNDLDKSVKETAKSIRETKFTIDTKELEQDIKGLTTKNWSLSQELPQNNQLFMSYETIFLDDRTLTDNLDERLDNYRNYYAAYIKEMQDNYRKIKAIRDAQIKLERAEEDEKAKEEYESLLESLRKRLETTEYEIAELKKKNKLKIKENKDAYDTLLENAEKIRQQIAEVETNYSLKTVQIEKDMQQKLQDNWIESNQNINEQQNRYYESQIDNFRDFLSKMNIEIQKQPVTDKYGFGIVDVKKTKKNYDEIIQASRHMEFELLSITADVRQAYKDGIIDAETYNAIRKQLIDLQNESALTTRTVENSQKNLIGEFIQSINQYIQAGLQAVQTVMQAINEYQDYEFDKQADFLDKENEMIEKKLSEQEAIVSRYKQAVDDIEGELATSRGDRRQHLIDQLNAEVAAQRAAAAEEKKLQKQKEANEKKQEELEKKRKQAEYKRNLLQILVSTAMATANGLTTQPFMPVGIAMGALATTLGMVQYALAQKAKPYANGGQLDGGVANGPRHRDGGIPVLGGKASIEGGEFITNRITTQFNTPLLEFINSRKKKVDISDLIEFYSSGAVKKNLNIIKAKFEDGGYIPPVNPDIKDQLQNIVVNQDNRPIYVTVTDIENKMEDVRYVRTLAGLK